MAKSIFTKEYALFLECLRNTRKAADLTQKEVANKLKQTQSFVSKCERGERRIDIVELRAYCYAIGTSLNDFVQQLEIAIDKTER